MNSRKTAPLEVIQNDGVLMHLIMIFHDISQQIDLSILRKRSRAKHLSYIIMLVVNSANLNDAWLQRAFKKFWKLWFLNIVIMFHRDGELNIYRYNPFNNDFLIKLSLLEGDKLPNQAQLFPRNIPNMGGKPLRMCMYHDEVRAIFDNDCTNQIVLGANGLIPTMTNNCNEQIVKGADGLMSRFIAERLNATRVIHRVSSFGDFSLQSDICVQEITQEIDDLAINTRFLAVKSFEGKVEYTSLLGRNDLCVLVPKAELASIFWNLFRSFTLAVWLTVLLSIPLAYTFCNLVHLRLSKREFDLLQLYATTLTMASSRIPKRISLRIFLFFWLFYGMLICNAFKGNLTSSLVFRKYNEDINTIQDLAVSPYTIMAYARHKKHLDLYLNNTNPYEVALKRKLQVEYDENIVEKIKNTNLSYAYVQKYHFALFAANARRHSSKGRPLFHVMPDCLVPFHSVYIVPLGSPYLGFINNLVRSTLEFGFLTHWESMINAEFLESGKKNVRNPINDEDPVVLKLAHFQAAFGLLFIGLTMAFVAFVWEIFNCPSLGRTINKFTECMHKIYGKIF
ncbi:ionotropic receptor 93a isoform X2 [Eurosta solidaginis]|uniref:ionotropic receptor 93a isoform X2 n=1 Tax=Eurosta solidaginis TaxID=178769 RepID=UPI0035310C2C